MYDQILGNIETIFIQKFDRSHIGVFFKQIGKPVFVCHDLDSKLLHSQRLCVMAVYIV